MLSTTKTALRIRDGGVLVESLLGRENAIAELANLERWGIFQGRTLACMVRTVMAAYPPLHLSGPELGLQVDLQREPGFL